MQALSSSAALMAPAAARRPAAAAAAAAARPAAVVPRAQRRRVARAAARRMVLAAADGAQQVQSFATTEPQRVAGADGKLAEVRAAGVRGLRAAACSFRLPVWTLPSRECAQQRHWPYLVAQQLLWLLAGTPAFRAIRSACPTSAVAVPPDRRRLCSVRQLRHPALPGHLAPGKCTQTGPCNAAGWPMHGAARAAPPKGHACGRPSCTSAGSGAGHCITKLPYAIPAAVQIAVSLATHAEALPAGLVHSVKVSRMGAHWAGSSCTAAAFYLGALPTPAGRLASAAKRGSYRDAQGNPCPAHTASAQTTGLPNARHKQLLILL